MHCEIFVSPLRRYERRYAFHGFIVSASSTCDQIISQNLCMKKVKNHFLEEVVSYAIEKSIGMRCRRFYR
jgi:hypothetical protein